MKIQYGSTSVNKKKNFSVEETSEQPVVSGLPEDVCTTLVVLDPDAGKQNPNDPRSGKYYLHWLVANIPAGSVSEGDVVVPYQGPAPPAGSGKHEYIFQVYEQPCGLTSGLQVKQRANFSVNEFLRGKNMILRDSTSLFVQQ